MALRKDLTGQTFGKLTITSYSHTAPDGRAWWLCDCNCGATTTISGKHLRTGNTKSCGCLVEGKLENQKFNRLTAIKKIGKSTSSGNLWLCKCECGTEVKVRAGNLRSGNVKSCGCLMTDTFWKGHEDLSMTHFNTIKRNAASRGISFEITIEYIWSLFISQEKRCALSGVEIALGSQRKHIETTASLDRIDSHLGYFTGNVQWVHKDVNRMKMDLAESRFVELCRKIANHHPPLDLN
jgi:hypothetical protein